MLVGCAFSGNSDYILHDYILECRRLGLVIKTHRLLKYRLGSLGNSWLGSSF